VESLTPIISSFCKPGALVLDPFCGSGSTLVAARAAGCSYLGIELDAGHHRTAVERLAGSAVPHTEGSGVMPWARPFTRYAEAAPS